MISSTNWQFFDNTIFSLLVWLIRWCHKLWVCTIYLTTEGNYMLKKLKKLFQLKYALAYLTERSYNHCNTNSVIIIDHSHPRFLETTNGKAMDIFKEVLRSSYVLKTSSWWTRCSVASAPKKKNNSPELTFTALIFVGPSMIAKPLVLLLVVLSVKLAVADWRVRISSLFCITRLK